MWKLHELPESVVLDKGPQFAVELTKKLNRMLEIKTKLLMSFYLQIDEQKEQINQELEQYLRFFVDYRQKDWPKWLVLAEFMINNKLYSATKISPFMANIKRKSRKGNKVCGKNKESTRGS